MAPAAVITTRSGASLDLLRPDPSCILLSDVAAALSKICRFGAQATAFYSVAQHAVEVAALAPPHLKLAALHHDSHEAFAGDLPTPLKQLIRSHSDAYDAVCDRLDVAIGHALDIDSQLFADPLVKEADRQALAMESRVLLADGGRALADALAEQYGGTTVPRESGGSIGAPLSPEEAERAFLAAHERYAQLPSGACTD